jgi:uncharacterized membrane protein YkoI
MGRSGRKWTAGIVVGVVTVTGIGVGVAVAAGGSSADPTPERNEEAAFTRDHLASARVTEEQAIAAALARHPGRATDVHLEDEGSGLRWEVKPDDGRHLWEVQVDASTGAVVSDQPDE